MKYLHQKVKILSVVFVTVHTNAVFLVTDHPFSLEMRFFDVSYKCTQNGIKI